MTYNQQSADRIMRDKYLVPLIMMILESSREDTLYFIKHEPNETKQQIINYLGASRN